MHEWKETYPYCSIIITNTTVITIINIKTNLNNNKLTNNIKYTNLNHNKLTNNIKYSNQQYHTNTKLIKSIIIMTHNNNNT